jgi:hypothetical protein
MKKFPSDFFNEEQNWRNYTPDYKIYYKAVILEYDMNKKISILVNGTRSPEIGHIYDQNSFQQKHQSNSMEKGKSFQQLVLEQLSVHMKKKNECSPLSIYMPKFNQNG